MSMSKSIQICLNNSRSMKCQRLLFGVIRKQIPKMKEEFLKVSVYSGTDEYETISGNISLEYALKYTTDEYPY